MNGLNAQLLLDGFAHGNDGALGVGSEAKFRRTATNNKEAESGEDSDSNGAKYVHEGKGRKLPRTAGAAAAKTSAAKATKSASAETTAAETASAATKTAPDRKAAHRAVPHTSVASASASSALRERDENEYANGNQSKGELALFGGFDRDKLTGKHLCHLRGYGFNSGSIGLLAKGGL